MKSQEKNTTQETFNQRLEAIEMRMNQIEQDRRDQELIERGRTEERERFKKILGNVFWRAVVPVCLSLATVLITKWVGV